MGQTTDSQSEVQKAVQIEEGSLSLRQFAVRIGYTHTAVRKAIQAIEAENEGLKIGISLGAGKAKMLSPREQQIIAGRLLVPAGDLPPTGIEMPNGGSITTQAGEALAVGTVQPLTLRVINHDQPIADALEAFRNALQTGTENTELLHTALVNQARQTGARLGTELALTKYGAMIQTGEEVAAEIAKKMGIAI